MFVPSGISLPLTALQAGSGVICHYLLGISLVITSFPLKIHHYYPITNGYKHFHPVLNE